MPPGSDGARGAVVRGGPPRPGVLMPGDRAALPASLGPYNPAQLVLDPADALRARGYPDTLSHLSRRRGRGSMTVFGSRASALWSGAAPVGSYALSIPFVFEPLSKVKNKKNMTTLSGGSLGSCVDEERS